MNIAAKSQEFQNDLIRHLKLARKKSIAVCLSINKTSFTFNLVPPLFVIEFLHKVVDIIVGYFSDCSETIIKDNCVVVYEVCVHNTLFSPKFTLKLNFVRLSRSCLLVINMNIKVNGLNLGVS